jgi:hypothetical protein
MDRQRASVALDRVMRLLLLTVITLSLFPFAVHLALSLHHLLLALDLALPF